MEFSSFLFLLFFLPALIIVYMITKDEYKGIVLAFASLFFYSYQNVRMGKVLLVFILINFLLGKLLQKTGYSKVLLAVSVGFPVAFLFYAKYTQFFLDVFTNSDIVFKNKFPLLGISFIVFSQISFIVDIYRTREKEISFLDYFNYITFFPKVISGPIVKYKNFRFTGSSLSTFDEGISRFIIGLSKKLIFAYYFGLTVDTIWADLGYGIDVFSAWIGVIAYSLQIYFDFSGYSDMAIGIAQILGYPIEENFNYPYLSKSMGEYWRRWHISLGGWFRDYVYFPLGGSRKGNLNFNIFIVFVISGIWHGVVYSNCRSSR